MQGSLMNRLMERSVPAVPEVGMGATELCYTDRHAGTIVAVAKSGKSLSWQRDKAIRQLRGKDASVAIKEAEADGTAGTLHVMSDGQEYRYEAQPEATVHTYTLRKNGAWVEEGSSMKNGTRLGIGYRQEYYDYSF